MNYLKDAFQLANDSKQHMEKLKTTVDEQSAILATLVRLTRMSNQTFRLWGKSFKSCGLYPPISCKWNRGRRPRGKGKNSSLRPSGIFLEARC